MGWPRRAARRERIQRRVREGYPSSPDTTGRETSVVYPQGPRGLLSWSALLSSMRQSPPGRQVVGGHDPKHGDGIQQGGRTLCWADVAGTSTQQTSHKCPASAGASNVAAV